MKKNLNILTFGMLALLVSSCGKHTHKFATDWTYDSEFHWHVCNGCEEIEGKAKHHFDDGEVTKEPDAVNKGERTYTCLDCRYQTKVEIDPLGPSDNSIEFKASYNPSKTYDGDPVKAPTENDYTKIGGGEVTVSWFKGEDKLESAPYCAGEYTIKLDVAATPYFKATSVTKKFTISKAQVVFTQLPDPALFANINANDEARYIESEIVEMAKTNVPCRVTMWTQAALHPNFQSYDHMFCWGDHELWYEALSDDNVIGAISDKITYTVDPYQTFDNEIVVSNKVYDGEPIEVSLTGNGVNAILKRTTYTFYNIDDPEVPLMLPQGTFPVDAGHYRVEANLNNTTVDKKNKYNDVPAKEFEITKAKVTINNFVLDKSYDGLTDIYHYDDVNFTVQGIAERDEGKVEFVPTDYSFVTPYMGNDKAVDMVCDVTGSRAKNYDTSVICKGNIVSPVTILDIDLLQLTGRGLLILTGTMMSGIVRVGDVLDLVDYENVIDRFDVKDIEINHTTGYTVVTPDDLGADHTIALSIELRTKTRSEVSGRKAAISKNSLNRFSYEASMYLYTKEEGGRHTPIMASYSPVLCDLSNKAMEEITMNFVRSDFEMMVPGTTETVIIHLPFFLELDLNTELYLMESTTTTAIITITSTVMMAV